MEEKKLEELRKLSIFQSLSLDELNEFVSIAAEKVCPDGAKIFSERETGDLMYIIKTGVVRIKKMKAGQEVELAVLGPGDFFGEVAIFRDVLRTATALAGKQVVVFTVTRADFNKFTLDKPHVAVKLLYHMLAELAKRLRVKNREGDEAVW
jgi:CRP/FNR family transcriptional regulator, cyclic AMP receptor protein